MTAIAAGVIGLVCLVIAALLLRRLGSGYRVARLLSAAPEMSLAEIVQVATSGERRYLRCTGRISSEEEFPDENQRPLVFRRRRLERGDGAGGWKLLDDERLAVPFGIEDRTTYVEIDAEAIGEGLVVVPRQSIGVAADLPQELRGVVETPLDPGTPIRLRIDQVSAVEHAVVAGMPIIGPTGPMMTAGLGRPLILSMVEPAAAMRLLAGDRRRSVVATAILIVIGLGSVAVAVVAALGGW